MDFYTRMSDTDANDYDKLKKALLTRYSYTEDGYRKRFREVKPEKEETPDQSSVEEIVVKWLKLSASSSGESDALVDLIVKEWFINACSEICCVPARARTQGPGRVNYMGSAVSYRASLQSSLNVPNKKETNTV